MSEMQDEKMKLHLLLQQLEMTDDQFTLYFDNALLQRVSIHRKSRVWQFNLKLENPLPIDVYTIFSQRINQAFSAIATIRLQITCVNTIIDEQLISSYWPFVIEALQDMSPPIRERLTSQKPVMTGGKMTLICMNDMELQTMKGKYAALISDVYTSFGFSLPVIDFQLTLDNNGAEEAHQAFIVETTS